MEYIKASTIVKEDYVLIEGQASQEKTTSVLLVSDLHLDSIHTDRKHVEMLFEEVKQRNAIILVIGDLFDAMGGRNDKRASKSETSKALMEDNYYDRVADDVAEFLVKADILDNIGFISRGNHEDSVTRHNELSLLEALQLRVYYKSQKRINILNKYAGFIRFRMKGKNNSSNSRAWDAWFHHGSGSGSIMSFGVLKTKRRQAVIEADIFISGHTHQPYSLPLNRKLLNASGNVEYKECIHIQLGTVEGNNEWALSKEFGWPNNSYYWLNFYYKNRKIHVVEQRAK